MFKKIVAVLLLTMFTAGSVSAEEDNNLTDTQLHAVLGIVTNFILSDDGIVFKGKKYKVVTSPYTGYKWLDRNLGASQACTSFDDAQCYGDYYQWGRGADGHQVWNSDVTTTVSPTIDVGHGDFIAGSTDWTNDSFGADYRAYLWSKRDGTSVCPVGFRVPTFSEFQSELYDTGSAEIKNKDDAFNSFLALPEAGYRGSSSGSLYNQGLNGFIWTSSSIYSFHSQSIAFASSLAGVANFSYVSGIPIRCMKPIVTTDNPPVIWLKSASSISMTQFDAYPDIGATAVDELDGVLYIVQTGDVNTDVPGTYTVTYSATDSAGQTSEESVTVTVTPFSIAHNGTTYGGVRSPYTGKVWLDRNLGASQVCTAFNDSACYGDYYQWGRNADGHQVSNSATTDTQATQIDPVQSAVEGKFITADDTNDYDWAKAVDGDGSTRQAKWSETDGTSVCPAGFRVPSRAEYNAELFDTDSAEIENRDDAFNSFLKLPAAGSRGYSSGTLDYQGSWGDVWASSVNGSYSQGVGFYSGGAFSFDDSRAYGLSVRCLRD